MKKIIYIMLFCAISVAFVGCNKFVSKEENHKIQVSDISIDNQTAKEILNNQSNFSSSDDFVIEIPKNIDHLSDFVIGYKPRQENKEFYDDFLVMFSYLFPNHQLKDEYFLYYGKNSIVDFDDDGNQIQDLNKVSDNLSDIISEKEDVLYFLYDESWYGTDSNKNIICAEFTSPLCSDLSRFNKGKAVQTIQDDILLETFNPMDYFTLVGRYSPDSMETFNLRDKKIPINEAVTFYENYINGLPYPENPELNMCVVGVNVLQINDNTYGYSFVTTKMYDGIPFDYIDSGVPYSTFEDYSFVIGQGFMIESDDVDSAYGIYRSSTINNKTNYTEMISFQSAAKIISNSLSDSIVFKAKKAELVYCARTIEGIDVTVENYKQPTSVAWKLTLFNPNDNLTYVCYIDAVNGENFRYYTTT